MEISLVVSGQKGKCQPNILQKMELLAAGQNLAENDQYDIVTGDYTEPAPDYMEIDEMTGK